jgi:hypothetical protein
MSARGACLPEQAGSGHRAIRYKSSPVTARGVYPERSLGRLSAALPAEAAAQAGIPCRSAHPSAVAYFSYLSLLL